MSTQDIYILISKKQIKRDWSFISHIVYTYCRNTWKNELSSKIMFRDYMTHMIQKENERRKLLKNECIYDNGNRRR